MRFMSVLGKLGVPLASLAFFLMNSQPRAFAETRLFVPGFRIGGGFDTQLLISSNSDRDTKVDLWLFLNRGRLLGQEQLIMRAHTTRSLTLAEVFGSQATESTGWLAAFSDDDGIQMSYNLLGDHRGSRDAETWPKREIALDILGKTEHTVRIVNTSSVENSVNLRLKDETGGFIGLKELTIGPFQQLELTGDVLQHAPHVDIDAVSEILAVVGESATTNHPKLAVSDAAQQDGGTLSLVIDKEGPVGAYQVFLRFDPTAVRFSEDDISGGSAAGFTSKPLAVNIDNVSGELRIASFQVGNAPQGTVDVAHIRVQPIQPSQPQFGLTVEEITDLEGHSQIGSTAGVALVPLN
jgi:hypothetical protein